MQNTLDQLINQTIHIAKYVSSQADMSFEERTATFLQYHVLSFLEKNPQAKVGDIAKHLHASLSSVTQLIERMHKLGLVIRSNDLKDRRVIRHTLTPDGLTKLNQIKENKRARMKNLVEKLDKDEVKTLLYLQEKLLKDL